MSENGFVKVYRSLLEWEWYDDTNTKVVFLHLLLTANWKETKHHGETIQAGEVKTTVAKLANELKLTNRQTRTALMHLETTNEVTIKTSPKSTIITIKNWAAYQTSDKPNDKQTTNKRQTERQTNDKQTTNTLSLYREERKKDKNIRRERSGIAAAPTLDEVKTFFLERNFASSPDAFFYYYDADGWTRNGHPVMNWQSLAEVWERREIENRGKQQGHKIPQPSDYARGFDEDPNKRTSFDVDDAAQFGILKGVGI